MGKCSQLGGINAKIVQFHHHLYAEDGVRRPLLDGLHFSAIDEEEAGWLR